MSFWAILSGSKIIILIRRISSIQLQNEKHTDKKIFKLVSLDFSIQSILPPEYLLKFF
jgi:hypothetical protein